MERFLYKEFLKWKQKKERKPLVLYGTRQVGKTYLLEEFGRREFKTYHFSDFTEDKTVKDFFKEDLRPQYKYH